ncbi:MAG TPA: class I tRNA ligase family protein [Syntrophales bacterium]|nr:class I tRNA ligase family protein [Syntrophales bacterium]
MLHFYNSMGKRLEVFRPANPGVVNIFTCGPSVYQRAHIGNFRTFLFEDVLVKYLEYSGYKVKRGMNFTDIEDKAVAEAEKRHTTVKRLTEHNIASFLDEMTLLNIKKPDYLPRASRSVGEAVNIIENLVACGTAYWHHGDVYFDPLKFKGFGKIYGLDMTRWPKKKRRFSKDTYPGMRWNLGDFILWHGRKEGAQDYWKTSIGEGRPAWNIQDASMVNRYFHETLSVYCGGIDNLIRHHDYTRAILESVRPYAMARYWLHCQHLFVNGQKMSKSKGNICYMETLLADGCSPAEIRFFLISNHYRQRMNYTEKNMRRAKDRLQRLKALAHGISIRAAGRSERPFPTADRLQNTFVRHMDNDLRLGEAIDSVQSFLSGIDQEALHGDEASDILSRLRDIDKVLNVLF